MTFIEVVKYMGVLSRHDTPAFICSFSFNQLSEKDDFFTSYSPYVMLMIYYCLRSMLLETRVIKHVVINIV